MGGLSIWHWLVVGLIIVGWVLPAGLVAMKAGRSAWWCVLAFPFGGALFLWWLWMADWREKRA